MTAKSDWLVVGLALLLVVACVVVGAQPGETIPDKIESLHRGCGERGESSGRATNCFLIVPDDEVIYIETQDFATLSGGSESYRLASLEPGQPTFDIIAGPLSLEMQISDGQWVVAPASWFACLPEGEVELVEGTVYCHSRPQSALMG